MAYDEHNADRIRASLSARRVAFRELRMMGGWCAMVDDKMCLGLLTEKSSGDPVLMVRVGEAARPAALAQAYVQPTAIGDRTPKGFVFVQAAGFDAEADLEHWVEQALAYNPLAKSSKRPKR